ncbi:MAG TPA: hypothetical protein VEV44_05540, partial [Pseudoneobacillus sp.]|nr:hypothetical protein [Pseudoneobacillus sp.]
ISNFDSSKPSEEFLDIVNNLIISASPADPESIINQLQQNLVGSDNGLYNSSVVYQNGLVYRYLENAMGFFFDIYVEGYEDY